MSPILLEWEGQVGFFYLPVPDYIPPLHFPGNCDLPRPAVLKFSVPAILAPRRGTCLTSALWKKHVLTMSAATLSAANQRVSVGWACVYLLYIATHVLVSPYLRFRLGVPASQGLTWLILGSAAELGCGHDENLAKVGNGRAGGSVSNQWSLSPFPAILWPPLISAVLRGVL